jgi:hypothetical protein
VPDKEAPQQRVCFIIGPIGEAGSERRRHADWVRFAIKGALEPTYVVQRADEGHPGRIFEDIVRRIRTADLIVADLSFGNPNAFYELAVAHQSQRKVLEIIKVGETTPFDVIDQRNIRFNYERVEEVDAFIEALKVQEEVISREGFRPNNPIAAALAAIENPDVDRAAVDRAQLESLVATVSENQRDIAALRSLVVGSHLDRYPLAPGLGGIDTLVSSGGGLRKLGRPISLSTMTGSPVETGLSHPLVDALARHEAK